MTQIIVYNVFDTSLLYIILGLVKYNYFVVIICTLKRHNLYIQELFLVRGYQETSAVSARSSIRDTRELQHSTNIFSPLKCHTQKCLRMEKSIPIRGYLPFLFKGRHVYASLGR